MAIAWLRRLRHLWSFVALPTDRLSWITNALGAGPVWTSQVVISTEVTRHFRVWPDIRFALYWREHFSPAASEARRRKAVSHRWLPDLQPDTSEPRSR